MKSDARPQVLHECERCHATLAPDESGQRVNVSAEFAGTSGRFVEVIRDNDR